MDIFNSEIAEDSKNLSGDNKANFDTTKEQDFSGKDIIPNNEFSGEMDLSGDDASEIPSDVFDTSQELDYSGDGVYYFEDFNSEKDGNKESEGQIKENNVAEENKPKESYEQSAIEKETENIDTESRYDDNGNIYKDENEELLPNCEYTLNETTYHTDENGRIIDWDGELKDTPENWRDEEAQKNAGGDNRLDGDQGGHLQGRQNGGDAGSGNLVAMRRTVNQGDYKKLEDRENSALRDGETVHEKGSVEYEGDSERPSHIHKECSIGDGEKTVIADYDNVQGSQELVDTLKDSLSEEEVANLKNEIGDMEMDGNEVSVTSVTKEYDSEGNLVKIEVGIRNETEGDKHYKTYDA